MNKVRFLRHSVLEMLRESVPDNLEAYRVGSFPHIAVDHSLYFEGKYEIDVGRLSNLLSPDGGELYDAENCRAFYAATPGLPPYEARDERLWVYMTHTFLLDYARKRWPIPADDAVAITQVRKHYFAKEPRQIERDNAGSRLWWMAHLCRRVNGLELADSLNVLLYRTDVRASVIERPTVSQNPNLFSALIRKLQQSYVGQQKLFERTLFRRLMQEINSVGGAQLLEAMSEEQITELVDTIVGRKLGLGEL
jgi:hypothetical protein